MGAARAVRRDRVVGLVTVKTILGLVVLEAAPCEHSLFGQVLYPDVG